MTYIELSKVINLNSWFSKILHGENESKLKILINNYGSAYIECDKQNKKYIKEIATKEDTYLLCVIPTVAEIKKTVTDLDTDSALAIRTRFIENIRIWAELSGIPIHKVHFADKLNYIGFCYSRDILIDTDKDRVDSWCNMGGVGILEE